MGTPQHDKTRYETIGKVQHKNRGLPMFLGVIVSRKRGEVPRIPRRDSGSQ